MAENAATLASIRIEGVTKIFDTVRALVNVSLEIKAGEVVAVMGPNGAGKSTLLSLLALNMRPTAGKISFDGEEVGCGDVDNKSRIGLLSHMPLVYPDLTARENLMFFARLHGMKAPAAKVDVLEEQLAIRPFSRDRACRALSRGQIQRVALGRAMLSNPELLLLDEPAAGLDSASVKRIGQVVDQLKERGGLALVVTHEPEVAARVATRAVMLRGGSVVRDVPAPASADSWRELYFETVEGRGR